MGAWSVRRSSRFMRILPIPQPITRAPRPVRSATLRARARAKETAMAETARMAVFHGAGKPFEIREYPVPDPEPGAMLIKVALANVCGSDLHYWRGGVGVAKRGAPPPRPTAPQRTGGGGRIGAGGATASAPRAP